MENENEFDDVARWVRGVVRVSSDYLVGRLTLSLIRNSLEKWIDRLILGEVDSIRLAWEDGDFGRRFYFDSEKGIEVFNYETIGNRYENKYFLYLYIGDLIYESFEVDYDSNVERV